MSDGRVEIKVNVEDSEVGQLNQSLGGIGGAVSKAKIGIKDMAGAMGLFKVGSMAIDGVVNSFGNLLGEMSESSKAWKTFEGNMAMIGKSSDEIAKVQASLQEFATQTIYSASDMASTYSQMAAIGYDKTEQLVKGMGGLAAASEDPQQAMKTMSTQMVQALAKPTLQWQDFQFMLDRTPAGMAQVAKHMGYSMDEFVSAVKDGHISSKAFADAVAEVGTNENFSKMAREFKSVGEAMEGARETIANKLKPAFELLSAIGIKAISGLADWIDTLDFSGLLAPIESLASMFGIATDEISAMTDTIKMSSEEIQSVADNWESMTLDEKQATVQTMGQEDLAELLEMLGVDFENIPDEYTKEAYLNAYGKDALEELLWVTGQWHDLTFEEKRAVLEAQIDNKELKQAIDSMELWENTEFYSKLADINMNDNGSEQQILDLINHYRELDGQEPIELEVDINGLINGFNKALPNIQKAANNIGKFLTTGAQKATKFFRPMTDGFVKIGKDMLGFYGSFGDMFDKIADGDWEGGLKVYSDAFSKTFDNIVDNSKNIVTGMKDNLFKAIGATSWSDVGTKVGSVLSDGIDWGASLLGTGWDIATSIVDKVTSVDWGNALYSFTSNVAGFAKNAYSVAKANLDERFGDGKLGQAIIDQIFNPDSELRVTLDKIDTAVTEGLKGAIDGVSEAILGISISDIDANLETLFGKIGDIEFTGDFGQLVTDIETAISESFGDFSFNDLLPELSWGTWEDDINDLLSWISAKGEEVKAKYRENFNFEGEGGKLSSGSSRGSGTGSGTVAFGVGRSQGTKVESPLKDVDVSADTARIETAIQTMYDTIQTMTTEANTQMETNFSDSMNRLFQTAMQGMARVNQAFTSGYQTGLVNARGFSNQLVMIFDQLASRLQSSGRNAGEGFALGLESTRGRIMSTARSIANEVVTTINKALDEHSPSRVLFKSGAFAGEGFALGLDSWIDRVAGISNNLAMASVPDLSRVNHKFTGVNGTISQIIQSANDSNNAVVVEAIESLEETLTHKQFAITSDEVADKTQNRLDRTIGKNAKYNEAWGVGG
ncbi:tape measure protein [Globicatella sanguinis]